MAIGSQNSRPTRRIPAFSVSTDGPKTKPEGRPLGALASCRNPLLGSGPIPAYLVHDELGGGARWAAIIGQGELFFVGALFALTAILLELMPVGIPPALSIPYGLAVFTACLGALLRMLGGQVQKLGACCLWSEQGGSDLLDRRWIRIICVVICRTLLQMRDTRRSVSDGKASNGARPNELSIS
jgi:hypothetical protein